MENQIFKKDVLTYFSWLSGPIRTYKYYYNKIKSETFLLVIACEKISLNNKVHQIMQLTQTSVICFDLPPLNPGLTYPTRRVIQRVCKTVRYSLSCENTAAMALNIQQSLEYWLIDWAFNLITKFAPSNSNSSISITKQCPY